MTILILAPDSDTHTQSVIGHLRAAGSDAVVCDLAEFPQRSRLDVHYAGRSRSFGLSVQGRRLDLSEVSAAWWRRPQPPSPSDSIASQRHRLFASNECQEALSGLWHAMDAFWINDPARDHVAHRKVNQLRVSQDVGLTIPETLITNDPEEAGRFAERRGPGRVVFKAFSAFEDEWRETRLLGDEELEKIENVAHAPVIFQEYVEAEYDVRLTVVGDQMFAAAIHASETSYPIDCRMDIANAKIEAIDLPAPLRRRVLAFMNRMGLVYGAIDFRRRASDGEFVFLEINPAGQWLFIEERTQQPISRALANLLQQQDQGLCNREGAAHSMSTALV